MIMISVQDWVQECRRVGPIIEEINGFTGLLTSHINAKDCSYLVMKYSPSSIRIRVLSSTNRVP